MGTLEKMQNKLSVWMQGRNGPDSLSLFLIVVGVAFSLVATILDWMIFSILGLAMLTFALYRSYSKNIPQRRKELAYYQKLVASPKKWFSITRIRWVNRKTTRYFSCECGATLSVPAHKGKVRVTCPQCHAQSIRKS